MCIPAIGIQCSNSIHECIFISQELLFAQVKRCWSRAVLTMKQRWAPRECNTMFIDGVDLGEQMTLVLGAQGRLVAGAVLLGVHSKVRHHGDCLCVGYPTDQVWWPW